MSLALTLSVLAGTIVITVAQAPPALAQCTGGPYHCAVMADDPLLYWTFDEGAGVATQDYGSLNFDIPSPGSGSGQRGLANGQRSGGPDAGFAGYPSSPVELPTELRSNVFTVEFWMKNFEYVAPFPGVVFGTPAWTVQGAGWGVKSLCNATNEPDPWCSRSEVTASVWSDTARIDTAPFLGGGGRPRRPRHVALVKSEDQLTVYVDGVRKTSVNTGDLQLSGGPQPKLTITSNYVSALFDEFAMYGTALSGEEVASHYWASTMSKLGDSYGASRPTVAYASDPVNASTGNFVHDKTILGYPNGPWGMDLTATFNQLDDSTSALALGRGWTTSVDSSIIEAADGSLVWRGPDGRTSRLFSTGTRTWSAPKGMKGAVKQNADPNATTGYKWALQYADGERWEYDFQGRLVRRCQGVADWATRTDWTVDGWVVAQDWCGTTGNGQYVTVEWNAVSNTKPSAVVSSTGMRQAFSYDALGRVSTITGDDDGTAATVEDRIVTVGYETSRMWISAPHFSSEVGTPSVAPMYPFEVYSLDDMARVSRVDTTAGSYSPTGDIPNLATATRVVENSYDATTSRVQSQITSGGGQVGFAWNDATGQTTVTAPNGEQRSYTHDSDDRLIGTVDPNGKATSTVWAQGALSEVPSAMPTQGTDRANRSVGAFYDGVGRVKQTAKPDAQTGFFPPMYNDANPTSCQRLPDGSFPSPNAQTTFQRPGGSQATMDCTGKHFAVESFTYVDSTSDRVDTHTDAAGKVTKYTYSGGSKTPTSVTAGFGSSDPGSPPQVTTNTYDGELVTSTTDGTGVKTCFAYNARRQLEFSTPGVSGACPAAPTATSTVYTYTALGQVKTVTPPAPKGTSTYTYFGDGRTKTVADPIPGHQPVTYAKAWIANGEIDTVTDETGQTTTTTTTHNVNDQTTCNGGIAAPGGLDPNGVSVSMPCKVVVTQPPSPAAATTEITDVAGRVRLTAVPAGPGGARTWYTYGVMGRLAKIVDPTGVTTQYRYTGADGDAGRVTETQLGTETGSAGSDATASVTYDARGRIASSTTPKNDATKVTIHYAYDQADRVIQEVMVNPATGIMPNRSTDGTFPPPSAPGQNWIMKTTQYYPTGVVKQSALYRNDTAAGANVQATVLYSYDAAGRSTCLDRRVQAASAGIAETHTFTATDYDPLTGQVIRSRVPITTVTGCSDHAPAGAPDPAYWAVSATSYNPDGSVHWEQDSLQYATHPTVDAAHVNYRTTYGYDAAGRTTSVQLPDPTSPGTGTITTTTCYTPRGELRATIRPDGAARSILRYDYHPVAGLVQTIADARSGYTPANACLAAPQPFKWGVTTYGYDGRLNRTSRSTWLDDQSAQVTESWGYDLADRSTTYSSNSPTPSITATMTYGISNGRLVSRTMTNGSAADGSLRRTIETYAPSGKPIQVQAELCGTDATCASVPNDAAHKTITATTYDRIGRVATVTDTSPGVTTNNQVQFAYNAAGDVTRVTFPNQAILDVSWNLSGQAITQTYPDGNRYRYRYDARLELQAVDISYLGWVNIATYTRNARGQRTGETLTGANGGSRTWVRNGATGLTDRYTQVLANTPSITTALTYDNTGRVGSECKATGANATCLAGDVKTTYTYDPAGQLLNAAVSNNATPGATTNWAYTYGNAGQRLTQTTTVNGTGTATTNYLTDPLTKQLCAAKTGTAPTSCNDPTATSTWTYDGAGRRLGQNQPGVGTQTYAYDPAGRLSQVTTTPQGQGTVTEHRRYDPLGQQNCATNVGASDCTGAPTATNNFLYWDVTGATGVTPQILQYIGQGNSYRYVNGAERISLWGYFFSNDYLGNTLAGPADQSAPTGYSPYGEPIGGSGFFRYRSELHHGPFLYLRARNYDTTTGTFTTRDPIDGIDGTTTVANPYAYTYNSPNNLTDPSGMTPQEGEACGGGDRIWTPVGLSGGLACKVTPAATLILRRENMLRKQKDLRERMRLALLEYEFNVEWAAQKKRMREYFDIHFDLPFDIKPFGILGPSANCVIILGDACNSIKEENQQFFQHIADFAGGTLNSVLPVLGDKVLAALGAEGNYDKNTFMYRGGEVFGILVTMGFSLDDIAIVAGNLDDLVRYGDDIASYADDVGRGGGAVDDVLKCAASFSGDTRVLMANGETKKIADVREGDMVLATDPETGESGPREVIATLPHTDQLLTLRTSSGEIVTTEDHRYWNQTDQAWQESQHLDAGDRLLTADGDDVTVEGLDWTTLHTAAAYDLDIAGIDTYYVGAGDESVLVHNCDVPLRDHTGKIHWGSDAHGAADVPRSVPRSWDLDDLEVAASELRQSIAVRRDTLIRRGNQGGHGDVLAKEENLLHQVEARIRELGG